MNSGMKSQLVILSIALVGCLFLIKGFGRVSDRLISPGDGAQVLAAVDRELENRYFGDDVFPRIDRRSVIVSENIPESWWREAGIWEWCFRPVSDSEFDTLSKKTKEPFHLIHLERMENTVEGHPKFRIKKVRYYWSDDVLYKRFADGWLYYSVVKTAYEWRAVYLPPTGTSCYVTFE